MTEKRKVVFHNVVAFWWKSSPGRGCGVRGTQRHGAGRCGAGAGLLGLVGLRKGLRPLTLSRDSAGDTFSGNLCVG